ncbi:hypothetical protein HDU93_002896, partial [Gonapodya sp. JEL0774]
NMSLINEVSPPISNVSTDSDDESDEDSEKFSRRRARRILENDIGSFTKTGDPDSGAEASKPPSLKRKKASTSSVGTSRSRGSGVETEDVEVETTE